MITVSLGEHGLESLFGTHDENLKRIERTFGVTLAVRGSELKIGGDAAGAARAERLMRELSELLDLGYRFRPGDVATAIRLAAEEPEVSVVSFFQPDGPLAAVRRLVAPRGLRQQQYLQAMLDFDLVVSVGPAGTGKTYLAVAMAAAALAEKKIRRIVLARPAVEAGEKLGFLPGDLAEKVNPYLRPLYDSLYDLIGYDKVVRMLERGVIEVAPLAFMRGRTLNDSFIILDEAQNTTSEQMKMFLTRIGFNSKAVINGDVTQVDLPRGQTSGLAEARQVLSGVEGIAFVDFDERDVVRHHLVQKIITAYNRWDVARGERSGEGRRPLAAEPRVDE
ncbi:MAG TPA: PhoH family protein [Thermoanaerobaculia bacterium]|nr:PhoH family protein [Thermoanaerobaculia bacterium]